MNKLSVKNPFLHDATTLAPAKFESSFENVGSKVDLYEKVVPSAASWSGYMRQESSGQLEYSLVTAAPLMVGGQVRFCTAAPLQPMLRRFEEQFQLNTHILMPKTQLCTKRLCPLKLPNLSQRNLAPCTGYLRTQIEFHESTACESLEAASLMLVLTSDISALIDEKTSYTYQVVGLTILVLAVIFFVVFFAQRSLLSGLGSAIFVLKALTEGDHAVDIRRQRTFLSNDNDEIGQLVSALRGYKEKLQEIEDIRQEISDSRQKRDAIIIEKMALLSDQLEGDARKLILDDIERLQQLSKDSELSSSKSEVEESGLISLAFERMSDQVTALIAARTGELETARDEAADANFGEK